MNKPTPELMELEDTRDWSAQTAALRELHADVLREPVPESLLAAAGALGRRRAQVQRWQRWGGMAAAVMLSFGLGWAGHMAWLQQGAGGVVVARRSAEFAHQAVVAHVVYSPEVRHPVEVTAAEQQHLVQWLSKRLNRPLKVPDLNEFGYSLVGGRLLPGEQGARAQFMYQNAAGERITLYVGALSAQQSGANPPPAETAFRFTEDKGASSFYWVDQGFGYALAGRLPRSTLLALAERVYKQL